MREIGKNESGFSLIEGLLIILVLAAIGFGGYYVWHANHKTTPVASNKSSIVSKQNPAVSAPPEFNPSVSLTTPTSYASASIPAVACDTGGPGTTSSTAITTSLSRKTVSLPDTVSKVSYYYSTTNYTGTNTLAVIAPSGWTCDVLLAQDGSEGLAVSSDASLANQLAGSGPYTQETVNPSTNLQLITISNSGACAGTCLDNSSTCTYFPSLLAAQTSNGSQAFACPKQPNGEIGSTLSSTLAYFGDPAILKGSGEYSGGINPDIGIVSYTPGNKGSAEWFSDCVLPISEDALCNAAMTNFVIENKSQL